MAYWLLKSEPDDYSYDDLVRDGKTCWDGVGNNLALTHIRKVKPGDRCLVYLTGKVKAAVGVCEAVSEPYVKPGTDEKLAVFDVEPREALGRPVTLKEIKADEKFEGWQLVSNSRLSVVPTTKKHFDRVLALSKKPAAK